MERLPRPVGARRRSPRREAARPGGCPRPPGALPDDALGSGRWTFRTRRERSRLSRVRPDALAGPQLRRPGPRLRLHLRADPRRGSLPDLGPPRDLAVRLRDRQRDLLHPHRQAEARPRQLRRRRADDRRRWPLRGPARRREAEGLAGRLVAPRSEGDEPRRPPCDVRLGERDRSAHDDRAPRRAGDPPAADRRRDRRAHGGDRTVDGVQHPALADPSRRDPEEERRQPLRGHRLQRLHRPLLAAGLPRDPLRDRRGRGADHRDGDPRAGPLLVLHAGRRALRDDRLDEPPIEPQRTPGPPRCGRPISSGPGRSRSRRPQLARHRRPSPRGDPEPLEPGELVALSEHEARPARIGPRSPAEGDPVVSPEEREHGLRRRRMGAQMRRKW
jgi:hypothetical protein